MKEIYFSKEKIKRKIDPKNSKVWLSKKQGKRIECVFKVGTEQFIDATVLFENENYILLGQNVDNETVKKIMEGLHE